MLSYTTLLSFSLSCGAFASSTRVPIQPTPCDIPGFHVQAPCDDSVPCLLVEFAKTLQAEQAVESALRTCSLVRRL